MKDIKGLIEFFDRICLEDGLYFVIPDAYGRQSFEFQWERKRADKSWRVRLMGHNNWHYFSAVGIIEFIHNEQIDVGKMARELAGSLLTQAVFARTLVRGVEELLGVERVDEAEQQTQLFVEQLKSMAASNFNSDLVMQTGVEAAVNKAVPEHKIRTLRVVKPENNIS